MTSEKASGGAPDAQHLPVDESSWNVDWFLQQLVHLANSSDSLALPITLVLSGATISGELIGGREYFRLFANDFVEGWEEGPITDSWRDGLTDHGKDVYDKNAGDLPPPNFIHLKNAKVHSPAGTLPSDQGVLWRGKVSAVSGFWYGRLVTRVSDD